MGIAYHFVGETLRDGHPVPADGEWLKHVGEVKLCASGLHWSEHPFDALQYAPGDTLCLVEYDGETIKGDDKGVSRRRRIVKRIDAEPLMREFARWCALQVIHLWDAPDVVRQYLTTGGMVFRAAAWAGSVGAARVAMRPAARDAARAAARAAALDAPRDVALDAAWAAARSAPSRTAWRAAGAAQREHFGRMVEAAFEEYK